jgi:hypothetical protein
MDDVRGWGDEIQENSRFRHFRVGWTGSNLAF